MFQTSDGVLIDYQVMGDSPEVVVFLNGIFMHYNSWLFAVEELKHHFKIILHNFRSQWTSQNAQCSFDRHADDLKELLEHLEIEQAHIVGTSYGGEIAMCFGVKYPSFVKTLTVITAAARINEALRYRAMRWREAAKSRDPVKFVSSWIDDVYSDFFLDSHENLLESIVERMKNFNYDGAVLLLDSFLQMRKDPLLPKLTGIKAPTLVVSAQHDRTKPPYFSEEIVKVIPNSQHLMIPNCGHAALIEKPREVLAAIKISLFR